LTHRFAAHPDERIISRANFIDKLVTTLEAYLSRSEAREKR
jgi:hypothetical protein